MAQLDPRVMLEDSMMWARAGYPAVAVGRYRDAAEQIARLLAEVKKLRRLCKHCDGNGMVTSWDVNDGAPLVQCECRK